ncbi:Dabb family protein [Paenibacillus chibensis]|uniref:Dabb family protein n=1 Tax=Paenibacillus chibensis TaxID=59846 RepID=A0ABU6PZE5_9BACL|nr:Dabb family protein [Paenibacillus chibensis]MEC0369039.1 Dabb family protein [Paenibacillus chibensis]MED5019714.1 Dabb family protein [Paenibacillus chibensis]
MIKHIVFIKLKDRTPESVDKTADMLRAMKGRIPQLLAIEVGVDVIHSERSFDIALVTEVSSLEDLQAYQVHPVHQEVVRHLNEVKEISVSVDYEI